MTRAALAALAVPALALACAACNGRAGQGPIDWDRMRDQPRYDAYGASRYFTDGSAMRQPPVGAVAVAAPEPRDATGGGGQARAGAVAGEIAITAEGLARGQNRYEIFCRPCHDVDGAAGSPVAKNMQLRQPPSLLEPRVEQLPAARLYGVISDGYGLMPSYAHQLTPDERWDVVAYVRALQMRNAVALADLPQEMQDEAARALASRSAR